MEATGCEAMLGALIGKGNTAEVFDMGDNKVVKLFKAGYPLSSVRQEFENSRLLNMPDLPIVKSYELGTYNGRYGIVYDRIDGESMLDLLLRTHDLEKYATALALWHKKILSHKLHPAVSLKSILQRQIEDTDQLSILSKSKLMKILEVLPDGDSFCHGDFHFGNVIVGQEQYYIIDYMNVCRGYAYGDIARTVYLIEMTPVPPGTQDIEQMLRLKKQAADIYLTKMGVARESLSEWLTVIAAARLFELSHAQTDEKSAVLKYLSECGMG